MTEFDVAWAVLSPFLTAALSLVGYTLVLRRIATLVQPYRLELARLGEGLLAGDSLPEYDREAINFTMDNAFNGFQVVLASVLMPGVIFVSFLVGSKEKSKEISSFSPEKTRFIQCAMISFWAANPIFGTFVALEFGIIVACLLLILGNKVMSRAFASILRVEGISSRLYGFLRGAPLLALRG